MTNKVVQTMMDRRSVRKYKRECPPDDVIETIVKAGFQAPFSYQLCSLLLTRERKRIPFKAPLMFTICVDSHRLELIMKRRNWKMLTNDLSLLFFGLQDASLVGENMVIAAESLGLGSCYIGATPYRAESIIKEYKLPKRVFPLVQLVMGYPDEELPTRPRYPLEFSLFESRYPDINDAMIDRAMASMDEGYLAQGYYIRAKYKIPLEVQRREEFNYSNYSWTEHISRKAGQWMANPKELTDMLELCGFHIHRDHSRELKPRKK